MRLRGFGGGFRFRRYLGQPDSAVERLAIPRRAVVPLQQGFGVKLDLLVKPGDRVSAGQVIGRSDELVSSPVHAPVNGTVESITETAVSGRRVPAVVIAGDSTDEVQTLAPTGPDHSNVSPERVEEFIYLSGAAGLGLGGIPTRFRSSAIGPQDVRHVLVAQTGAEPFNPAVSPFLAGSGASHFVAGLELLSQVLVKAKFHIVLGRKDEALLAEISRLGSGLTRVAYYSARSRYPQDSPEMLTLTVLGEDFPFGFLAANVGIVVLDPQAVIAVYDAVASGRPVVERVVALSGPGFVKPIHVRVRVGTPVADVVAGRLREGEIRIVRNSLLTGPLVLDRSEPVLRTDSQFVALPAGAEREPFAFARPGLHTDSFSRSFFAHWLPTGVKPDANRHGEERPCIQCGWCARVCPVRIIPHLIYRHASLTIDETLVRLGAFNCIDCGLCTFVCPSKVKLAARMREAKDKLVSVGCDNSSCVVPKFDLRGIEEYKGVKSIR